MCSSFSPLEYQEAGCDALPLLSANSPAPAEPAQPVIVGIPEDEVERRIQLARDAAFAEADERVRNERERAHKNAQERVEQVLKDFTVQRAEYFRRVEGEVVQLALAIARKILQRETELDPTLLSALVRIALDRMQCGTIVRIRVATEDVELWRGLGDNHGSPSRWEVDPDETLSPGDCIVETELGKANFGFDAQLRDVEESFSQLLAHRPDAQSRDAARA